MGFMLPPLHGVRGFVHIQPDHTLDLGNISSGNPEAQFLSRILPNVLTRQMLSLRRFPLPF